MLKDNCFQWSYSFQCVIPAISYTCFAPYSACLHCDVAVTTSWARPPCKISSLCHLLPSPTVFKTLRRFYFRIFLTQYVEVIFLLHISTLTHSAIHLYSHPSVRVIILLLHSTLAITVLYTLLSFFSQPLSRIHSTWSTHLMVSLETPLCCINPCPYYAVCLSVW